MIDMQALMDGMSAMRQRERAEGQLTLGALIAALEAMTPNTAVANLRGLGSYRGYYCDLYFELHDGTRLAHELLADCRAAMGTVFDGYKGGIYVIGAHTPLWISRYGYASGTKLIAVRPDGTIETEQEQS